MNSQKVLDCTPQQKNYIKHRFMQAINFPGFIGVGDCTHVAILTPKQEKIQFRKQKGLSY
ncbi:hypothetical protein NQ314_007143 [Rhamnusium bicolor]|uniref:DDE Tnp4 domain-containing protein n=1 Tax=Rhamnusium bicolor TaxID=1586634 RepID=A0AAV8YS75_9CUCU|nr:hypothetical protein NQ314_007143 [Rhamnusium bicolor]